VLDSTVLVAALRSDQGASRQLVVAALGRKFTLLLSVPLIIEYESVLTRQEHLDAAGLRAADVAVILDSLVAVAEPIRFSFLWRPTLPDPADDMVLEFAARGWVYTRTWRLDSVRIAYQRARSLNSNGIWAYVAHFYVAVDSLDQAVDAFRESFERDPAGLGRRSQLAYYLACAGAYDDAWRFGDPEVLNPLGVDARSARARILFRQRRFEESAREFEAQLRGETPPALMPYAFLKGGDTTRAAELLEARQRAAELSSGYEFIGDLAIEDRLTRGDTAGLIAAVRDMVERRAQRLQYLKCSEVYPDLIAIPGMREILTIALRPAGASTPLP